MIHIREDFLDKDTIAIIVDGVLDQGTIPILGGVCDRHLEEARKVLLNLEGVVHISREGRRFPHGMREKLNIANLPEFVKLEKS